MINTGALPMPLGVRTALVEVELSDFDIEELKLSVPDRYYVLNFERAHSYGPVRTESNNDGSNYYDGWSGWYDYASRIGLDQNNFLVVQIVQQINWELIVCPMFAATGLIYYGRHICRNLVCFEETFYGAAIAYLSLYDPQALVDLGADYNLVLRVRNSLPLLEREYIDRMRAKYAAIRISEGAALDWEKMWMAYFGFQFYNPPPPPAPPESLEERINKNRAVIYKEPLVRMGSGLGAKGHFAYVSYIDPPEYSIRRPDQQWFHPNIYIDQVFSGVKSVSDVAFWRIDDVWRFLENGNEVIIDGWRWNGVYLWQSRHLILLNKAISRLKGFWVLCDEAFYKLFNYLKEQSTTTQYRVFAGWYGNDVQYLRTRAYLDRHKRLVVMKQKKFAFVDVSTFTVSNNTPTVLFGNLRMLKLSVNDVFYGYESEPLNVPS